MNKSVSMTVGIWLIAVLAETASAQPANVASPESALSQPSTRRSSDLARVDKMIARLEQLARAVRSREIACKLAELRIETAKITEKQLDLKARRAKDSDDREQLQLDRQKAVLQIEIGKQLHQLAQLELESAQSNMKRFVQAAESSAKESEIHVEYIEELGVLILRGNKADVEKIKKTIEKERSDQ